jgi:hypothetical protein
MGTLEAKRAKATQAVIRKLELKISRLGALLKVDGNPDVVRKINETMIWTGVSMTVMRHLAKSAEDRAEAAQHELRGLREFIEGLGGLPSQAAVFASRTAQAATIVADQAQSQLEERARYLLRPLEQVHYFDRAVVLKVWSEHLRVLGKLADARDLGGLVEALEVLAKTAVEKVSGTELFGLILDLLDAARKRQRSAEGASELFDYLDQMSGAFARWSFASQRQILRLDRSVSEDKIDDEASKRVLATFKTLWAEVAEK